MKNLNLDQMGLTAISLQDAAMIDGGDWDSGFAAGNAAGKTAQAGVKEWGVLNTLKSIAEALSWL